MLAILVTLATCAELLLLALGALRADGHAARAHALDRLAFQALVVPLSIEERQRGLARACETSPVVSTLRDVPSTLDGPDMGQLVDAYIRICAEDVLAGSSITVKAPPDAVLRQFDWRGVASGWLVNSSPFHFAVVSFILLWLAPFTRRRLGAARVSLFVAACWVAGCAAHWLVSGTSWALGWPGIGLGRHAAVTPWDPSGLTPVAFGLAAPFLVNVMRTSAARHGVAAWRGPSALGGRAVWGRVGWLVGLLAAPLAVHALVAMAGWPVSWHAHAGAFVVGLALEPWLRRSPQEHRAALAGTNPG